MEEEEMKQREKNVPPPPQDGEEILESVDPEQVKVVGGNKEEVLDLDEEEPEQPEES